MLLEIEDLTEKGEHLPLSSSVFKARYILGLGLALGFEYFVEMYYSSDNLGFAYIVVLILIMDYFNN